MTPRGGEEAVVRLRGAHDADGGPPGRRGWRTGPRRRRGYSASTGASTTLSAPATPTTPSARRSPTSPATTATPATTDRRGRPHRGPHQHLGGRRAGLVARAAARRPRTGHRRPRGPRGGGARLFAARAPGGVRRRRSDGARRPTRGGGGRPVVDLPDDGFACCGEASAALATLRSASCQATH